MRFSQDFIERVREATNIVDVIGQQVQLRRSGTHRLVGLCPFHNEKSPSFSVSEDKQMYFCFGCKKAGNVYTYIQETQGLSFPETVEMLAGRAGIAIPQEAKEAARDADSHSAKKEREKLLFRINQFAANYFQAVLKSQGPQSEVQKYLQGRGLSAETIEKFQLGFALDEWENFVHTLQRKQVPLEAAESLGLIRRRGEGKVGHYDIFRHRLMFPILSLTGNVIGFGGRILGDGQPKYLNSPESDLFHKGKVFYGLHESAKHIRVEDRVIVVEGYMDFLALYQAGVKPVVATLGTALTTDHARVLKRLTKNIIVLFDGDEAGQTAAERSLPLLLAEGLIPRGLNLPDGLDPDEFVQKFGLNELESQLKSAPELFKMIVDRHMKGYRGTSAEKVQKMDVFTPWLKACSDRRLRDLYVAELAERLDVDVAWVERAHAPTRPQPVSKPSGGGVEASPAMPVAPIVAAPTKIKVVKPPRAELYLLNLALLKEKYFQWVRQNDIVTHISNEGIRQVLERMNQLYGQMPSKFDSLTASLINDVEPKDVVSVHLQPPIVDLSEEGAEKLLADCARKVKEVALKAESKKIRANMRGEDPRTQLEKLEQIMNIQRSRHSLNKDS